ncbi:MAG: HNH endonuclease [bacterium]|nr:MAG: HNH endonuclease [bacterium]
MPRKPLKQCNHVGCPELVEYGYCEKHKRLKPGSDKQVDPFYGSIRWKRFRAYYIKRHPFCEMCLEQGLPILGEIVDHIIPIREGGQKLSSDNAQSLCRKCHARKHR